MAWNQRPGPSGSGPSDGWMRQFLRREAEQQVGMLTALRERLQRDLERRPDELPGKEWVRIARLYQDGYRHIASLELEHAKLALLAERAPMTDEEVARWMEQLGREAVRALSDEELEAEIERRRALPAPDERSPPSG